MSKIIATAAIRGAHKIYGRAEEDLAKALETAGADTEIGFPDTAYYLPTIYAMTGMKVDKLGQLQDVMAYAKELLSPVPDDRVWLPYLGQALDAGISTLLAEETIEALKPVLGKPLVNDGIWLGPTDDVILRKQGIKLVDGSMPGFAACVGAMPTNEAAVKLANELRSKNILVFMAASTNGKSMAEQLAEEGVQMGWDTYLVPYGKDITAAVHALGFAARSAMTFGGITPGTNGQARDILLYNKNRVFAFVLALGDVDDEKYATAAGAINFGFPVIADTDIPQILPSGVCTYEHVVSNIDHEEMVQRAIEVRGVKIQVTEMDLPVNYGPAFEGERIRKDDVFVEFGSKYSDCFELVQMKEFDEVTDGKVEVIGPSISDAGEGSAMPLAIVVEVAGKKMQKDFEPILERQLHHLVNGAEGVMHIGQRDITWIRVSKAAVDKGFAFEHLGTIFHDKLLSDYPAIVDKVQVKIYTEPDQVKELMGDAKQAYADRDERIAGMTDDSVDVFYSCTLCQSFAPNHVCIITPQRLGLCGAYNWLDGRASYEINPTGHNQPVDKGETVDVEKGIWDGVNKTVYEKSNQHLEVFSAYSMMENPMTSCGCFECIVALLPLANGVMVVHREFPEMTPCGMKFSTLAGTVGGGEQVPGFIGVGKQYLASAKFISADGGVKRIVWMPKELKEMMRSRLEKRAAEEGEEGFVDKIADETVATTEEEVLAWMEKVGHPALGMDPML
ncbi:MAG: CO dehydrogenase/CO-methylating acetyl-CoA synthase complex subunit beta [Actinobacteria bacterium]|nr:MAG: CO dehydrogenase/CO-methylating acetyl-CoA synthase complex subunit beta [Actinomycetota bacterium]